MRDRILDFDTIYILSFIIYTYIRNQVYTGDFPLSVVRRRPYGWLG
jgi:hypothetical protein